MRVAVAPTPTPAALRIVSSSSCVGDLLLSSSTYSCVHGKAKLSKGVRKTRISEDEVDGALTEALRGQSHRIWTKRDSQASNMTLLPKWPSDMGLFIMQHKIPVQCGHVTWASLSAKSRRSLLRRPLQTLRHTARNSLVLRTASLAVASTLPLEDATIVLALCLELARTCVVR